MLRRRLLVALLVLLGLCSVSRAWELHEEWTPDGLDLVWTLDEEPGRIHLQGQDWLTLELKGAGLLGRPGEPALPLVSRWVELPVGSGLQIELIEESWESVPGVVLPEQGRVHQDKDLPLAWQQDARVYQSSAAVPAQPVLLGEPALIRGTRVRQFSLVPARCLPARGVTELLRGARWHLSFQGQDERNNPSPHLAALRSATLLPNHLLSHPRLQQEADRSQPAADPGTYLVFARGAGITANSYFIDWLAWKRQKGHVVHVIDEAALGSWTETAIRDTIRTAVSTWEDPPVFVALFGDTGSGLGDFYVPTNGTTYDHNYACVSGDDILGDVAVGRISVESSQQLNAVLYKLMIYELTPTLAGSNWLTRAGLAVGDNAVSMEQHTMTVMSDMMENGITTPLTAIYTVNAAWVNTTFNSGICLYNYRGWINMNGVNESFITNSANFTNSGMTPITAIFTCSTGDFESFCETEAFLRKGDISDPRGASAALGFATSHTNVAYNNAVAGGFWSAFLDRGICQVGTALFQGKATLVNNLPPGDSNSADFSYWANLMGDPGMDMWCGVPAALVASLAQGGTTFSTGGGDVEVVVTAGGNPVADALVCLWQSGLQVRGRTDAQGRAWLSTSGAVAGPAMLTASKPDCIPSRVSLTASAGMFPQWVSWNLPGDGKIQPNETVTVFPIVRNTGSVPMTGLNLTVAAESAGLTIVDGSASWPTIAAGAQATASNGLTVTVGGSVPDASELQFAFSYTSGQGAFHDGETLPVSAPLLQVSSLAFAPGGRNLVPGHACALTLGVINSGDLAASDLTVQLSAAGDPFATVTSGTVTGLNLEIGGTAQLGFSVLVDATALRGHQVPFTLAWSGNGLQGEQHFTTSISVQTFSGPTGPDAYGYRAIEDTDANTLAPMYQWVEIAPPSGGTGTLVNLQDYADSDDDAAAVALPFVFRYYGVNYSSLSICSNGFVSFEPGAETQTDYRNHFLPCGVGPDAMIAAMWDDHYLSGTAGVYTKYDAAGHQFIIEWYHMLANGTNGTNTFQLLLKDPAYSNNPTGDGDFRMQYQVWDNTQSNSQDFPGCSVGIKDEHSARGMTLTNYLIDDPTIGSFGNQKAILFTTAEGEYVPFPDFDDPTLVVGMPPRILADEPILFSAETTDASGIAFAQLTWRTNGGAWQNAYMNWISGTSWTCELPGFPVGTVIQFQVTAEDLALPANSVTSIVQQFTVSNGTPPSGPDSRGYYWFDNMDGGEGPAFVWMDIAGQGTTLVGSDDVSTTINLPFPIVYYGTTYNTLTVCSNGWVVPGSTTGTTYSNVALAAGQGEANMICAFWDDLNPGTGGQVRAALSSSGDRFVISWIGVPRYGTSSLQTFQLVFLNTNAYPTNTGDTPIISQYLSLTDATSCTVGHQNGTRSSGISYLYDGALAANAAAVSNGQALLLTTGATPLMPVSGLQIAPASSNVQLSWLANGSPKYRIYSGPPYGVHNTLEATVSTNSASLPITNGVRAYDVRSLRDYQGASMAVARGAWEPVTILEEHAPSHK